MTPFALIIPTYQSAHTIEETLRAVLALGDELNLLDRLVITDDGSSDSTLTLVHRVWQEGGAPIPLEILRAAKNRGEYLNVNSAVMSLPAHIEWYLMMHADNLPMAGWVRALVDQAKISPADVGSVCTSFQDLWLNGNRSEGDTAGTTVTWAGYSGSVYGALRYGCWWHNSTAAVRVSAFKQVGGMPALQDLRQMGDWDFSLRLMGNGFGITYIARPLVLYRENEQSVSSVNFLTHRDMKDRIEVTKRYCHGCPLSFTLRIFSGLSWMLLRRTGSSLIRAESKRFWSTFAIWRQIVLGFFYCVKRFRSPFVSRTHRVEFEERKHSFFSPHRLAG